MSANQPWWKDREEFLVSLVKGGMHTGAEIASIMGAPSSNSVGYRARQLGVQLGENKSCPMGPGWTEERVERLRELWADGVSHGNIAKDLGWLTKNAVIGKVHRLKLNARPRVIVEHKPKRRKYRQIPQKPVTMQAGQESREDSSTSEDRAEQSVAEDIIREAMSETATPFTGRPVDIVGLTRKTCRYPLTDGVEVAELYCGSRTKIGSPYCSEHHSACYQPQSDRKRTSKTTAARVAYAGDMGAAI